MAFTIHGLDEKLDDKLTERARRERMSKNKLVKKLLARAMGMESGSKELDEYREFLGRWTLEDLNEFEQRQIENRRIDKVDWR